MIEHVATPEPSVVPEHVSEPLSVNDTLCPETGLEVVVSVSVADTVVASPKSSVTGATVSDVVSCTAATQVLVAEACSVEPLSVTLASIESVPIPPVSL